MIKTPFRFEPDFSDQDFGKLGQFALRWSHIDHTIGNCLRRLLNLDMQRAAVIVFPLSLNDRMARIGALAKLQPLDQRSQALFDELKPLIKAMQFLRTTALHSIVVDEEDQYFHLRSKHRDVTKAQLFGCEDLINYAAHVTMAFRLSLGDKEGYPEGLDYALPDNRRYQNSYLMNAERFRRKIR